jgi:hypothetical protein
LWLGLGLGLEDEGCGMWGLEVSNLARQLVNHPGTGDGVSRMREEGALWPLSCFLSLLRRPCDGHAVLVLGLGLRLGLGLECNRRAFCSIASASCSVHASQVASQGFGELSSG